MLDISNQNDHTFEPVLRFWNLAELFQMKTSAFQIKTNQDIYFSQENLMQLSLNFLNSPWSLREYIIWNFIQFLFLRKSKDSSMLILKHRTATFLNVGKSIAPCIRSTRRDLLWIIARFCLHSLTQLSMINQTFM